jgi:hypothetical protein
MTYEQVPIPTSTGISPDRSLVRPFERDARLGQLRPGGNQAAARGATERPTGTLARCAGPCTCGGRCGELEADEELLRAGQRAMARAVLARRDERRPAPPRPAAPGQAALARR